MRLGGNSLGAQLERLKNALLAGGEHTTGHDDDAAIAAIDGAVKFVNYWQAIPSEQQEAYFNQYPSYRQRGGYRPSNGVIYAASGLGLEQIIRRFIRPTASDASECVEVTASYLDTFLWRYRESIHNDTGNIEEACNAKKTQFETAIKQDDYQVSPPLTNIPDHVLKDVLLNMLSEPTEHQQTFFESIASLLSYAAEKRPSILLDLTADRSTGDEKKYITACSKYITRLTNVLHKYPDDQGKSIKV